MNRQTQNLSALLLVLSITVSAACHAEADLSGYWQHESDPMWIEMQPDTGQGVMVRNDNRPGRAGFLVVTDLEASDGPNEWSAQVFAMRLGEYRKAEITLVAADRMVFTVKVGLSAVRWSGAVYQRCRLHPMTRKLQPRQQ